VSPERQGATTQHKLLIWRSYVLPEVPRGNMGHLFVTNGCRHRTLLFCVFDVKAKAREPESDGIAALTFHEEKDLHDFCDQIIDVNAGIGELKDSCQHWARKSRDADAGKGRASFRERKQKPS